MKTLSYKVITRQLLIDGFNLIYKFPELEEFMLKGQLKNAMQGLLRILKDYQSITKKKIRVVFDGKKEEGLGLHREKSGKLDIYYSIDYSADFLIMQFIKKDPRPRMTTVVSSDNEILFYVNRFRTPTLKSEHFAQIIIKLLNKEEEEILPEKEEKINLSPEELNFWERLFKSR